jgi:transcriptional regulator with XRE-family HTH domain
MQYDDAITLLRKTRIEQKSSLAAVGSRVGVSRAVLSHWEQGRHRPKPEDLALWAEALGHHLIVELIPKAGSDRVVSLLEAVMALPQDDQVRLLRLAQALGVADEKDREMLHALSQVILSASEAKTDRMTAQSESA